MQPVSGRTLMMAVQAVQAEMERLDQDCAEAQGPEVADLQDLLETYRLASIELRDAYIAEWRGASNLPPYEQLIGLEP
jgi:hypothetical protein